MRIPATRDLTGVDVAIIGIPFDSGTTYRPGARFGPRGIRNASGILRPYPAEGEEAWGPFVNLTVVDYGDVEVDQHYIDETVAQIQAELSRVVEAGVMPVCLGGDHTISLPILRALAQKYGSMALVDLDAHPDFREPKPGRPYSHATPFRIAVQEGLIDPRSAVQVGIRGPLSAPLLDQVGEVGVTAITADEITRQGLDGAIRAIDRIKAEGRPTYVSLDIDCVDPAFAPGTGVPEVGGLTSREVIALVRSLRGLSVVGFDIVEVAPAYDVAELTSLLAATLVYEFLLTLR
jgi:agmatinase